MELDFDKFCVVDGSPTTVLPARRNPSKVADRKPICRPKHSQDFREISFNRYRSASCRDVRSNVGGSSHSHELLKRGSEYLSSKDVSLLRNKNDFDISERKKIELSRDIVSEISLGIIDSLCSFDGNSSVVERGRSSAMSQSGQSTSSSCKDQSEFLSKSVLMPHTSRDKERAIGLHKSLSAKLASQHSLSYSDVSSSASIGPKMRFKPPKKTFDPSVKCKPRRSPLSSATACEDIVCKSWTNDVSGMPCNEEVIEPRRETITKPCSEAETSPAHLNGFLKVDSRQGVPLFEFSVNTPDEFYVAKTWKVENGLTRVYTFHSPRRRRKSDATRRGLRDSLKEFPVLGQMHVSCRQCTAVNRGGCLDDKMVTEFVLYDTVHSSRKSTSSEDNSSCFPEVKSKINSPSKHSCEKDIRRLSNPQPIPSVELHPFQEVAAIVMEFSLEKRESLKFKADDRWTNRSLPSLLELCQIEQAREEEGSHKSSRGAVHIVISAGNHGSPSGGTQGPSPLLERWRSGGGCDCGGWDMACPLSILGNSRFSISQGSKLTEDQIPAEIFPLGKKDNLPAFAMRRTEDGKYTVSFHAQLSSLQAFSICVAILHSADTSAFLGHDGGKQTLESDSLRVFPEEEIKNLIEDALSEEEKLKSYKRNGQALPQSFVVNPPFSPIARV